MKAVWLIGGQGDADVAPPRVTHPVDRLGDVEMIDDFAGGARAVVEGEVAMDGIAAPVSGAINDH